MTDNTTTAVSSLLNRFRSDDTGDGQDPTQPPDGDGLDLRTAHALSTSADSLETEYDGARSGEQWVRTYFITGWPDEASPGMLDLVTTFPSHEVDVGIHAHPRDPERAIGAVDAAITDLQKERAMREGRGTADTTERRLADHRAIKAELEGGQQLFDVSVYVTIRGDSKDDLDQRARRIERELERKQISATPVDWSHDEALVATSPVALDTVRLELADAATPMLGEALGALFPFSAATIAEPRGVPLGFHGVTDELVMVDRFDRANGYNVLVLGEIGAGKSFGTKLWCLREMARREDTVLIMVDPLNGFAELAETLDAERFVVGGRNTLNPLELRRTPQPILDANPQLDPYGTWFDGAVGFFESFIAVVAGGASGGSGGAGGAGGGLSRVERSVLGEAIHAAAQTKGITREPGTHGNPSPTVGDVEAILGRIERDAKGYLDDAGGGDTPEPTAAYAAKWEEAATDLRIAFRPFQGEYAHLAGESQVDLRDATALYVDIQQGESDRELALSMQPALNTINERAKGTDKRVILAIDEAHYLMQNEEGLDWLERRTRHSRHFDLSLMLVSQEASDFLVNEQARTIANNCSMKMIFRESGITDGQAQALGLSAREAQFVRDAEAGTQERGWSHALVAVQDAATIPVRVAALPTEAKLIDGSFGEPVGDV